VGPDNFLYAYRSHYVLPGAWEELNLSHPHNLVLDLLTRLGIFGLAAGAWLLTATFVAGWQLLRSQWAPIRPYYLGLYVGLAAGLAHGLTDNSIFLVDLSILTLFVVAVSQRLQVESRPELEGVAATA
jgi:O-antigen ligase